MKRSSKLALVSAAGIAAVVAYTWYSGNADAVTESNIYTSVSDCISSGNDEAVCKAHFGEAMDTYTKTAPRFVSQQDCEKDFGTGACMAAPTVDNAGATANNGNNISTAENATTATTGGTSYFMPMMMGFMMGRMMQNARMTGPAAAPMYGCASGMSAAGASCYASNSGRSYQTTAGSRTVRAPVSEFRSASGRGGFSVIPRGGSAMKAAVSSRGGFGSTGRGYSSRSFGG